MEFNDMLRGAGFDLREVAVMLHQPPVAGQRNVLLALAADAPDLFELYQDNHPKGPEATLKARKFAASFVVNDAGEARFVGLYHIVSWAFQSYKDMMRGPQRQVLGQIIHGEAAHDLLDDSANGRAIFNLAPLETLAILKGRLVVPRPAGRAYVRLAENCALPILRIDETARFIPPLPSWDALILTAAAIRTLPKSWAEAISQWRGIYHIIDTTDGARYVGAAYGTDNILGRWAAHVAGDKGVTVELAKRDPADFEFSILELLAPNAPPEQVALREIRGKNALARAA